MAAGDLSSLATVGAAVIACMGYARLAARRLRPGLPRSPRSSRCSPSYLSSHSHSARFTRESSPGSASPGSPSSDSCSSRVARPTPPDPRTGRLRRRRHLPSHTPASQVLLCEAASACLGFVEHAAMAALLAAVTSLYRYEEQMHEYVLLTLYTVHVYLALELVLLAAAAAARALMALDLEPQFDRPYLSASLGDFWGRRWNLCVTALLRQCVFRPVRAHLGASAGVLAAFAVSGLMHEAMFSYITLRPPTGEAAAFMALHGACTVAEGWWAHEGWPRPPRALATPLTMAFVGATAFWLFFPPIMRNGADKQAIRECEAIVTFLRDATVWARLQATL